jgi:hypothetical protein
MKKIIATILLVGGLAAYVNAQGTFTIDSFANNGDAATPTATTNGLVFRNGVLDTGTDISLTILWGLSAGTATTPLNLDPLALNAGGFTGNTNWIASQPTGSGDIADYADGAILDPNGNSYAIPGEAAGTTIYLIIEGWTGNYSSYASALLGSPGTYAGVTSLALPIVLAASSSPTQPDIHGMPSLNLVPVPEPTTLAIAAMGGLSLLGLRRRKA